MPPSLAADGALHYFNAASRSPTRAFARAESAESQLGTIVRYGRIAWNELANRTCAFQLSTTDVATRASGASDPLSRSS